MLTRAALLVLNTFSNYVRYAIVLVVLFLLTPFIIGRLGEAEYGLWSLTFSVLGVLALVDLGFGTAVVKYVAECKGTQDTERRNRLLSTIAVVYVLLALVATAGVGVLSALFNRVFAIPAEQHNKAIAILWLLAARSVVLSMPLGLFRGALFGEQRIYVINAVQSASVLTYAGFVWLALDRGFGIVALAVVNLGVMVAEHVAFIVLAFTFVKGLRLSWALVDRRMLKEIASFSTASFVANVSALILLRSDPILVKLFLPLSAVAVYAVALKIAEHALLLIKQFVNALTPLVVELKGRGDDERIRFILVNCTKFALAPAAMLAAAMYVFGCEAMVLWVGPEFRAAGPVLLVLMTAMACSVPQMTASNVLAMTGHHKFTARASMISVGVNVVLSIALARPLGLLGIALGTLGACIAVGIMVVVRQACLVYGVSALDYARRAIIPALLPAVLQVALTCVLKAWRPPHGWGQLVLATLPGVALYGLAFWSFSVEPAEKQLVAERLLRWRRVRPRPEPVCSEVNP